MTSHRSRAIRLLGSATLLFALPTGALPALAVPVQVAQAQQPAPQPAQQAAPQTTPLTVPVQQAPVQQVPDDAQRRGDDRRAYVEAGIAALHAGLLLTPAQQTLWPSVETALRDLAATRGGMRRERGREEGGREEGGRRGGRRDGFADPVARLKERGARLVARGQAMEKLADASAPLLAALTPEQKERVPRLLGRIMHGRMGMRGGRYAMERGGMDGRGMDGRGMDGRGMDGRAMGERFRGGEGERTGRMDDDRR